MGGPSRQPDGTKAVVGHSAGQCGGWLKPEGFPGLAAEGRPGPLVKKWEAGKSGSSVLVSGLGAVISLHTGPLDSATHSLQLQVFKGVSSQEVFPPIPSQASSSWAKETVECSAIEGCSGSKVGIRERTE